MVSAHVQNEPILTYAPGSSERAALESELLRQAAEVVNIPVVVNGTKIGGGERLPVRCPHDHHHVLANVQQASAENVQTAIQSHRENQLEWSRWSLEERAAVFLRAADLLSGPWRHKLNAATMLGQSKTVHQAEIDSACELIDFLRWNVQFARELQEVQPISAAGARNALEYRPLEGFVYAVAPFNFTAIGGNLACAPALMGNTVLWKPAATAALSNYFVLQLLEAAGLPPGVINFVPGDAKTVSSVVLGSASFAGIHFTGSTAVFDSLWRSVSEQLPNYRSYPRLVGETGGKDFVLAHASADADALSTALLRGAFEYQGQKCSAASRAYIPVSLWPRVKSRLLDDLSSLKMGDVRDFSNFMGAVIDQRAYDRINGYIDIARRSGEATIIAGGQCDARKGYFVSPTVIEVNDPRFPTMQEEIFGPVLSVYVYRDEEWPEILKLVDETGPYGLTGSIFSTDRAAINEASAALRFAAGNFYVNDKPTGAVVGQQPFGGARRSGTNDKAGSMLNLLRWVSPRTVKETYVPATDYRYPHMKG
ncbi:L-glutamate gamma-semialdehyde dehydrogenase [Burkholderia cenocepacia]|uniref:L-glutamate gamma-semialdehyde dehydrogenase n=1 Tax=Burkholderia cenocepacia TaxID=95486 RepID=UPI000F59731F|nr:L-glutamate gamma-semialdehyde dehydrogenase [Burkholderia cenocepacia]RQT95228.1 L-glutamate gamma-semialdehyde dehydrogenase [Burkholderia cenocepacia]RQU51385.1 L-glutamate gamma-semialdehyde dehydrogenase [Burkholderia cenocepacia]